MTHGNSSEDEPPKGEKVKQWLLEALAAFGTLGLELLFLYGPFVFVILLLLFVIWWDFGVVVSINF